MSSKENINESIQETIRRVQQLKDQEVKLGRETPPEILNEVETLEAEIGRLYMEMVTAAEQDNHIETDITPPYSEQSPATNPPLHIAGDAKVGVMSSGGVHHIGNQTFDMSENTTNLTGDISGSNVNINSRLENVSQKVGAISGSEKDKEELSQLVEKLKEALAGMPPDKVENAEKISTRTDKLVAELEKEKPDEDMVDMLGNGLKKAAENVKGVMPIVLEIAAQIVTHAMKFVGS